MTRHDTRTANRRAPLPDSLVEVAAARAGRVKKVARRPELRKLLERTLAGLELELPGLRAAEVAQAEVVAFLADQIAALSEPDRVAPVRGGEGARGSEGVRGGEVARGGVGVRAEGARGGESSRVTRRDSGLGVVRAERGTSAVGPAESAVLHALRQLERESPAGALLSVRELRARSGLDKPSFDRAALALASRGRVSLHAHDHAGVLPEGERRALVEDARGVHYVGIASMTDARHEVSP